MLHLLLFVKKHYCVHWELDIFQNNQAWLLPAVYHVKAHLSGTPVILKREITVLGWETLFHEKIYCALCAPPSTAIFIRYLRYPLPFTSSNAIWTQKLSELSFHSDPSKTSEFSLSNKYFTLIITSKKNQQHNISTTALKWVPQLCPAPILVKTITKTVFKWLSTGHKIFLWMENYAPILLLSLNHPPQTKRSEMAPTCK